VNAKIKIIGGHHAIPVSTSPTKEVPVKEKKGHENKCDTN